MEIVKVSFVVFLLGLLGGIVGGFVEAHASNELFSLCTGGYYLK